MSLSQLQFKYNTLTTQLSILTSQLLNYVTLNTIQTITSKKIFVVPPQSSAPPIYPSDLANRRYVDSIIPTPLSAVLIDGSQTLGDGVKTFTNLPQSSATPTDSKDFVTKTYIDSVFPNISNVIYFAREDLSTGKQYPTPILPAGKYLVSLVFTLDFPYPNKAMNISLIIANADADLFYTPPIQYTQHFEHSLSGIVTLNTERNLIGVLDIGCPMTYRCSAIFTYQSV